ncbi:MAG: hypothetical protein WCT37_03600 [Patescibacteria group bacterium]|jgi:hypothetical protein
MSFFKKILLIIGIIVAVPILLFAILMAWFMFNPQPTPPTPGNPINPFEEALADPHLLYAASSWYGLCHSEISNKDGGCDSQVYLYDSGKYVATSHWAEIGKPETQNPQVEKQLNQATLDEIIKTIRDSEIMNKKCPDGMIVDAGWDYQIQLDGKKKRFIDRPVECQPTLEEIDKIIATAVK